MALLTPQEIASASVAALEQRLVLGSVVWRDADVEFGGKIGDTVTVRVEDIGGDARTFNTNRSAAITVDELSETGVDVTLSDYIYKALNINDEDLTLKIRDFTNQVGMKAVKPVARGVEGLIATKINALTASVSAVAASAVHDTLLELEADLNDNNVPMEDRFIVVGTNVRKVLLQDKSNRIVPVDASGSPQALRRAIIGDLYGATVVYSNLVDTNSATFMHQTAFALANRALAVPNGAVKGSTEQFAGYAMRVIQDYDPAYQRDRLVASTLAGCASVLDGGVVKRAAKFTLA